VKLRYVTIPEFVAPSALVRIWKYAQFAVAAIEMKINCFPIPQYANGRVTSRVGLTALPIGTKNYRDGAMPVGRRMTCVQQNGARYERGNDNL
jgi:hypothetical protein